MNEKELTEGDKQLLNDVVKYGLHVVHIMAEKGLPAFSFSVGLFKNYSHPELLIVGLNRNLSHSLINNMAKEIKVGKKYQELDYYSDILQGFNCYFIKVDKSNYREYVGYASWFYGGDDFPVSQCVYPTTMGIYPWQKEWPESIKNLQPLLGDTIKN